MRKRLIVAILGMAIGFALPTLPKTQTRLIRKCDRRLKLYM